MVPPAACAAQFDRLSHGRLRFWRVSDDAAGQGFAGSDGGNTGVSWRLWRVNLLSSLILPAAHGVVDLGVQGNSNMFANMACQSIEVIEAENPLQVSLSSSCRSRWGGKFRGGVPYRREYTLLDHEAVRRLLDRREKRPYGLYGGRAGKALRILNPDGNAPCSIQSCYLTLRWAIPFVTNYQVVVVGRPFRARSASGSSRRSQ